MKKLLALVLCLCFALSGCTEGKSPSPTQDPSGAKPAPMPAPLAAESFDRLALRLAALPELPDEPDESALWESMDGLNAEEQNKLLEAFSEKQTAYDEAVEALRGSGIDPMLTPAFTAYTLHTARQLFADTATENVVYSPANLYLALCMLAETADGDSRAQVLDLLGLSSVEQARAAANALWRNLYRDGATGKTLPANSIWLGEDFTVHEDTVDTLANDHFASTFRAPMGKKATDDAIHAWINENTNHLLEDAANGLETDPDTLMMLISTLYFKGTWASEFAAFETREDTFTAADGTEQRIDFMHKTVSRGAYRRGANFTVASLPFRDGTAMWFLLPDEGTSLDDLWALTWNLPMAAVMTLEGCYETPAFELLAREEYGEIRWSVPKFDVESGIDLIPALQSLGVVDVFVDGAADFSPLTDTPAVVSAVEHAARVKVDEEGCEAAAFTEITVMPTAAMPEQLPIVEMDLDRPFGFLITGVSGLPLFAGIVNAVA